MKKGMILGLAIAMAAVSQAQVLAINNFDTMSMGAIAGQQGWSTLSDPFLVSNNRSFSGPNAVLKTQVNQSFGSEWAWPDIVPEWDSAAQANKIIKASVMMYLEPGTGAAGIFGLDAYQFSPTFGRVAAVRVGMDGSVRLDGQTTGTVTAAGVVAMRTWNKIELFMNYATGTATASINGTDIGLTASFTRTQLSDVDLVSTRNSGATNSAWFDDYKVEAVPEPASMTALGLGLAALLRRRTKKA